MPALPPYIPAKDAALDNWANNFSTLITAGPGTYGLVAADAVTIAAAFASWHTAYQAAISLATRGPATVATKNTQRINMLAVLRPYAQTISLNAGVSPTNKTALGINPRTSTPTPITAPATNPVLTIDQALTLQHVVRARDSIASPSVKSKPYGVVQMQLFAATSTTPITDPALIPFKQVTTKSPLIVEWSSGDKGKIAYYTARWATRSGLVGPFSPIASFTVAG